MRNPGYRGKPAAGVAVTPAVREQVPLLVVHVSASAARAVSMLYINSDTFVKEGARRRSQPSKTDSVDTTVLRGAARLGQC